MKKPANVLMTFLLILFAGTVFAQDFEGIINLQEKQRNTTVYKKIYVKGDKVKIETYTDEAETDMKGAKIIDLASGKVTALLPSRNLYFDVPNRSSDRPVNATVNPTGKTKDITVKSGDGEKTYTCKQIVVKSAAKKVGVAFWMAKGNFTFYAKMMQTLAKHDNVSTFFKKIEEKHEGTMPMLIVEKRPDGTVIGSQEVTEVTESTVDDSTFDIPEGYSLMER